MVARTIWSIPLLFACLSVAVQAADEPTLAPDGPALDAMRRLIQKNETGGASLSPIAVDESPDPIESSLDGVTLNGCDSCCGSSCDSCCGEEGCDLWYNRDLYRRGRFYIQSWLDQGFTWNPADTHSRVNAYVTPNDRVNEYQMNQFYLVMGRRPDTSGCRWDYGARVDLLYGTDYFYTEAVGLETRDDGSPRWNAEGPRNNGHAALYGLAMPQMYAELYAPMGYGTTIKIGHFYTIMGYESVMAPENFFYSHPYVMQYGEPYTHTGMLASYRLTPRTTIHSGLTRGWNTWEDPNQELSVLGGMSWISCDRRTTLNFTLHSGKEDQTGDNNRTSYSLVYSRKMTDRLTYVFQHDLGVEKNGAVGDNAQLIDAHWYGINQYLFYQLTCKTSLGFRFEWFNDPENARLLSGTLHPHLQGGDVCAATVGLNWKPWTRVTIRPELRWDWSNVHSKPGEGNIAGLYNDFTKKNQFNAAVDMVMVF